MDSDSQLSIDPYQLHMLKKSLEEFGKDSGKILNKVLRRISTHYKKYIIKNYLNGQMLGRQTGDTVKSMIAYKDKKEGKHTYTIRSRYQSGNVPIANIYEHDGGANIVPTKTALKFVINGETIFYRGTIHLDQRPFMSSSFESFNWNNSILENGQTVIDREIKQRGF